MSMIDGLPCTMVRPQARARCALRHPRGGGRAGFRPGALCLRHRAGVDGAGQDVRRHSVATVGGRRSVERTATCGSVHEHSHSDTGSAETSHFGFQLALHCTWLLPVACHVACVAAATLGARAARAGATSKSSKELFCLHTRITNAIAHRTHPLNASYNNGLGCTLALRALGDFMCRNGSCVARNAHKRDYGTPAPS